MDLALWLRLLARYYDMCYAMLCHAMLCYVTLWYDVLWYVIWYMVSVGMAWCLLGGIICVLRESLSARYTYVRCVILWGVHDVCQAYPWIVRYLDCVYNVFSASAGGGRVNIVHLFSLHALRFYIYLNIDSLSFIRKAYTCFRNGRVLAGTLAAGVLHVRMGLWWVAFDYFVYCYQQLCNRRFWCNMLL